jgi:hypothetical protein
MGSEDLVVSPELVLVDPELALRVRSFSWIGHWSAFPDAAPAEAVPAPEPEPVPAPNRVGIRRPVRDIALTLSLALNAFVLVNVYDDSVPSNPVASRVVRTTAMFLKPPPLAAIHAAVAAAAASDDAERRIRSSLRAPGVSVHCDSPLPVTGPAIVPCWFSRIIAGERVVTSVQYRGLSHGSFRLAVIG